MSSIYTRLLAAAFAFATTVSALSPLQVNGRNFVNPQTKQRFQIIGIDYQPGGSSGITETSDPLTDASACLRDAALMQRLGVNTIRVYNLSPKADHSHCASIFNAAGIYMLLDVNSPLSNSSLNRAQPWTTYDSLYLSNVFGIIENFKNFPNVLGFFAGNEVINQQAAYQAPAYIRAVQRDMKDYIAKNVDRTIPVGYSAADVANVLMDTINYLQCNLPNATNSRSDFFGLNDYQWCGNSSYTRSGYSALVDQLSNVSFPFFFSEYGCNAVEPRTFTEVGALYSPAMDKVFSGGLVYEWTQQANNYGLVQLNSNNTVSLLIDYVYLQDQYNQLDVKQLETEDVTSDSVQPTTCDPSLISSSGFLNTFNLPARPSGVQSLIDNGVSSVTAGTLVKVTATAVPETVYSPDGQVISGITLKILSNNAVNTPGNYTSNTSTASGSAASASSTSKNKSAAEKLTTSLVLGLASGAFVISVLIL